MKNIFNKLITLTLLITLLILNVGCLSENSNSDITLQETNIDLMKTLSDFNEQYSLKLKSGRLASKDDKCDGTEDDPLLCDFAQTLVIASADLAGAAAGVKAIGSVATGIAAASGGSGAPVSVGLVIAGGIIGGAGASFFAADISEESRSIRYIPAPQLEDVEEIVRTPFTIIEVGKYHNKLLTNYYNRDVNLSNRNNKIVSAHESLLLDLPLLVEQDELSIAEEVLTSEAFLNVNNDIEEVLTKFYGANGFDPDLFVSDLLDKELLTEDLASVLTYFYDIYLNAENISNVNDISDFYQEAINKSNLSDIYKEALIAAFSVAIESPSFWGN